jgi:hypothetical protein
MPFVDGPLRVDSQFAVNLISINCVDVSPSGSAFAGKMNG